MSTLMFICIAAGLALFIAWLVNALVGWMSGEHPGDTGRQAGDVFFRILGVVRLGMIGRLLDRVGWPPWVRWIIYFAGGVFILSALLRTCSAS